MSRQLKRKPVFRALATVPAALILLWAGATASSGAAPDPAALTRPPAIASGSRIVAMRRLSESQYRNVITDVFGPDLKIGGHFEPIVRPAHHLVAAAASAATLSPAGLEQFDLAARNIATQVFDAAHRDIYVQCRPLDPRAADSDCARQTLTAMGRYLFRRPLTAAEQAAFVKIADKTVAQAGSFYDGMTLALAAMLVSPSFLYVMERAEPDPANPGEFRLDNYSRASRLSFLLWDTAPTEALLQAAAEGQLTDQAKLNSIAAKMVKSQRLEAGVRAFFSDMLVLERLNDLSKDTTVYPRFNADVAAAMPEQILRTIVDLLVTRDSDYRQLFTTRRTFMTRVLGPLYGVQVTNLQGWVPYVFGPDDERAGILTQAGLLSPGDAQVGRSSPTIRGRAIRELLLCQVVPDPPGNVNFTAVTETKSKSMPTAKVRLAQHISNPVCAGCHRVTDPIGLMLERFDGIGAFRATENDAAIDTSAVLEGTKVMGAAGLGLHLSTNPSTTQCVAGRALEYATGMPLSSDDKLLPEIHKSFASAGYRISSLFLRIATAPEAYRVAIQPPLVTSPQSSVGASR